MKSFLQGKRTLDMASLRPAQSAMHPHTGKTVAAPIDGPAAAAPQIELVKQGDKIVRIIVTCTCGERTEIECLYPPGQQS